jgi:hypothetical protein
LILFRKVTGRDNRTPQPQGGTWAP